MHDLGDIRSLLHGAPTRALWGALCAALDDAPRAAQAEVLVPYCLGALRRWPDRLRVAPRRWCDLALDGDAPPALAVSRAARLDATGAPAASLRAALDSPLLTHLTALEVATGDLDLATVRAVTHSSLVARLDSFSLSAIHRIQPRALSALLNAPRLDPARAPLSLELTDTPDLDVLLDAPGARVLRALRLVQDPAEPTFEALCASTHLEHLRELDLSMVALDPGRSRKLAAARHLHGVRRLELSLLRPDARSVWSMATLEPLLFAPVVDALEHLDIKGLDDVCALALAQADALEDLTSLSVALHDQRSAGALAPMLRAESRVPLESLRASGGALEGTLRHVCSPELDTLDLSNVSFRRADLDALRDLPSLTRLTLFNPREVPSLADLVAALPAAVERLALDGLRANAPDDLEDLSTWRGAPHAEALTLRHVLSALPHAARADACAMLDLSAWSRLRVLDLGANQLSDDDDVGALLRRAPHLDTLSLRHNQLTDPAALADALPAGLRTLHVSSNPVSPKSLGDLLASGALDDLHTLSMSNLRVDDELLAGILRRSNLPRLHSLSARRCQFGPESARALADSGLLSTLRELDVAGFRQDRRAAAAIAQIPEARHLTRLVISFAGPIDLATLTDLRASQHLRPRILDAMSSAYDVDYDAISI